MGGRKRGRETLIGCLLYTPWPGTNPKTQACARTRNQTSDFFALQENTQATEPHQSGLLFLLITADPRVKQYILVKFTVDITILRMVPKDINKLLFL